MLIDLMRRAWKTYGDRVAIVCESRQLTYRQLADRTHRVANALRDAGIVAGDRVASLGRNRIESMEEITGVAAGAFVRVPLYVHSAAPVWAGALRRTGSRALIVDAEFWPDLRRALEVERWALDLVLVRDETSDLVGATPYEAAMEKASPTPVDVERSLDDVHIIRFSAGTTGVPKAIAHSERAWCSAILGAVTLEDLPDTPSQRFLVITPYSHGSGMGVWGTLASGGCHVIMPKFEPEKMLELIEAHEITQLFLVATMMERLTALPDLDRWDVSSVQRISYGTCSTPERLIRQILSLFPHAEISQAYGQSELAGIVTVLTDEDHRQALESGDGRLLRSAGRPLPTTAVRIEDESGNVVPNGTIGEIVARSPGVMMGIWNDPVATAERITPDGWVRTRDLGHLDDDGYLWVADRLDDLIITGGFNVWPAEIENALENHPAVTQAIVFGVPHDRWGETPMAVVRLRPGHTATEAELIAWCEANIGKVKRPNRVHITEAALPMNSVGKLLRRQARETFAHLDSSAPHDALAVSGATPVPSSGASND